MSDLHAFHVNMPRNTRELVAFMLVVSVISVNVIPLLISGLTVGFSLATWAGVLRVLPLLWVAVVAVVLATTKPAQALTGRLVRPGDSFHAHVVVSTLCSVFLMSLVLTIVGTWIGTWRISAEPVTHFAVIVRFPCSGRRVGSARSAVVSLMRGHLRGTPGARAQTWMLRPWTR